MNWALSNLTGSNRVSRAILVRYSQVPLTDAVESVPQTPTSHSSKSTSSTVNQSSSSSSATSSFAATFLHGSRPGRAVPRNHNNNNGNNNNNASNNSNNNNNSSSQNHHGHNTATTTASAATSSSSSSAAAAGATGTATALHGTQISLPLDVEETVTCFCRKARRKERDGDQNSTDTKLYLEESVLERKLPEADLKALVDLPAGLDYNEWLASHTLALFEHVNLVYGTISEFCTPSGCPDMTGPGNRTYLWFDEKGKKTRVAAPQYIDYVMTFTQKTVSDESIFPTKYANEFPSSFESIARKILRLQFHVIAHLYAAHFREIALLGLHTHLNLTFAHLTALHRRFNLIDEKETDVLRDLEVALRLTDDTTAAAAGNGGGLATGCNSMSTTTTTAATTATGSQSELSSVSAAVDANEVNLQLESSGAATTTGLVPICTQPEANLSKSQQQHHHHFGGNGGDGLVGGILGDLSTGEFGDTMRYCTSAVPSSSSNAAANNCSALTNNSCSTTNPRSQSPSNQQTTTINSCNINEDDAEGGGVGGVSGMAAGAVGAATFLANGNNGAGALNNHHHHLNNTTTTTNHNNNHNHHHHHHHPHPHPHAHAHHHHTHYAPNTGLIQCNATNAPTAPTSASTSTTA